MMMALGTFVFSLDELAYQQLQHRTAWRHASTARVGARPAHQYVGPDEETIQLSGLVIPGFTGSVASLDTLRKLGNEGKPLALVDGAGTVHGAFVIASLDQTRTLFFKDGTPRKIEFQMGLTRTDDGVGTETTSAA